LNLPPDDQKTLELQHWIIADAMNIIYNEHHTSKDAEDAELLVGVNPILLRSIDDLKLSHRSNNVLWNNNTYLI
jgi:hypothetical protein